MNMYSVWVEINTIISLIIKTIFSQKSLRFPKAKFFCRLCDYHMDAVVDCQKHCKDNRHRRRNEVRVINICEYIYNLLVYIEGRQKSSLIIV